MQGEAIVKRILSDANLRAEEIVFEAEEKANLILQDSKEYAENKIKKAQKQAEEKSQQIFERYETLSRIEGNKIMLNKKQNILKDLKNEALDVLLSLSKQEKLDLVSNLLKNNAESGETVLLNIKGLTNKDVEDLEVTKKLKLKVDKNKNEKQVGIILSSESCDKNLLFNTLIADIFEQNQLDINKLLF